jgi:hypothetical protein
MKTVLPAQLTNDIKLNMKINIYFISIYFFLYFFT